MTVGTEPRTSRTLPVAVAALFGLLLLVDLAALTMVGHHRGRLEDDLIEVTFRPWVAAAEGEAGPAEELPVPARGVLVDDDGRVLVESAGQGVVVRAKGALLIRFRVVDAGAVLELDYRFLEPDGRGRCEIAVGRVASSHGVDVVRRLRLAAVRRATGTFRHELADHVGWFELRFEVNRAAAGGGFEVGLPRIVRG